MGLVVMGVDLGQKHDPTAICLSEAEQRDDAVHFLIRYLTRLPLGTTYPDVAKRITEIAARMVDRSGDWPTCFVDATGVGVPVIDILNEASPTASIIPVYFTHGDRRATDRNGDVKLGKAWLVSRLQVLLQYRRLHLPETSEARQLAKELMDYEIRVDQNANDTYGAFKVGAHDDLVTAVGLATQEDNPGVSVWFV